MIRKIDQTENNYPLLSTTDTIIDEGIQRLKDKILFFLDLLVLNIKLVYLCYATNVSN